MAENNRYEIVVSEKAMQGLGRIISYIAFQSVSAASKVKVEIIRGIQSLDVFPERYPFLAGDFIPYNKYRKLVIMQRYLIIYQIQERKVFVDFVVDCRQDYQWLLH